MRTLLICAFTLTSSVARGELSTTRVFETLKKHTIACCSVDLDGMLATIPKEGIRLVNASNGASDILDRAAMRKQYETYFAKIQKNTYCYALAVRSIEKVSPDEVRVNVETSDSYIDNENIFHPSTSSRETLVFGIEDGRVVLLKTLMQPKRE